MSNYASVYSVQPLKYFELVEAIRISRMFLASSVVPVSSNMSVRVKSRSTLHASTQRENPWIKRKRGITKRKSTSALATSTHVVHALMNIYTSEINIHVVKVL